MSGGPPREVGGRGPLGPERARARARAYALLAALYREGPTPALALRLADVPPLADALPRPADTDAGLAEHTELFSVQVPPYGGAFLEADGTAGGRSAEPVRVAATWLGSPAGGAGEAIDHLAVELELLARAAEGEVAGGAGGEDASRALLSTHLLWWLPPFVVAVEREGRPFWALVAGLTLELALDHLGALEGALDDESAPIAEVAAPDLSRSETRLHEVVDHLARPARAGLLLSPASVRRLGRALDLPVAFGDRRRVLGSLFEAAAEYGVAGRVVEGILDEVAAAGRGHEALAAAARGVEPATRPWRLRLDHTAALLRRMREATAPS